jgi:uncharacterized protein (DUF3084 family)
MAGENGHDRVTVQMVELLGKIHAELVGVNTRVDETNRRLDELKQETRDTLLDLVAEVHATNGRLDVLTARAEELDGRVEKIGDRLDGLALDAHDVRKHEERIARLEEAVFKKAS